MGTRVKIVLVVLAVALVGVIVWRVAQTREREPVYNGRTLTSWLQDLEHPDFSRTFEAPYAVNQIGTNAIPILLRTVLAQDSAFKTNIIGLMARQHFIKVQYTPAATRHIWAAEGFLMLNDKAKPAIPSLIQIASQQDIPLPCRTTALRCLGNIGPAAKEAVPYLMQQWTTNANANMQFFAELAVAIIDPSTARKAGYQRSSFMGQGASRGN